VLGDMTMNDKVADGRDDDEADADNAERFS
jgi:hypothetical protein